MNADCFERRSNLFHLWSLICAARRWDATWTAVPGSGWDPFHPSFGNNWENQALFDFEYRALPAMKLFNQP